MKRDKITGFNLLELMLALVIITSMILLIGTYYQTAKENIKIGKATHLLNQIVDASFKYLESRQPIDQQEILPTLVQMDLLPEEFKNILTLSPWDTTMSAAYRKLAESNAHFLEVLIFNVPEKSCYQLTHIMKKALSISVATGDFFSCISSSGSARKDFKGRFVLKGVW